MAKTTKIYGAPGTGKTTTLLNILEDELSNGTKPTKIAYVTFSVAAKQEAINRVQSQSRFRHLTPQDLIYFRTIHGICYFEIGMTRSCIMQPEDYLKFAKSANVEFSAGYTDEFDIDGLPIGYAASIGNKILNIRQVASSRKINPFSRICMDLDWPEDVRYSDVKYLLGKYDTWKVNNGKCDYVDLLEIYMRSGEMVDVDVAFIDEAQDLSSLQWGIIDKMFASTKRIYVAGDDDQSIYGFLGSNTEGFLEYPSNETITLGKSYRLAPKIWDLGNRIISKVKKRQPKNIIPTAGEGNIQYWGLNAETVIESLKSKNIMVIASNNYQLMDIKNSLSSQGISFDYKGNSVTGGKEASVFYWYNKARKGESIPLSSAAAILRAVGLTGARGLLDQARENDSRTINRGGLEKLGVEFFNGIYMCQYLAGKHKSKVGKFEQLYNIARKSGIECVIEKSEISLTTYHGSKGSEADSVVLITDCSPAARKNFEMDPDYERRVAYVGITRAKRELHVCQPTTENYIKAFNEARI